MNHNPQASVSDAFSLTNETALITGGGSGLGFAIAKCFVASGARVALVGRRETELARAAGELGERATFVAHDITTPSEEKTNSLIEQIEDNIGRPISILVNNAGIHLKKSAVDTTPDEFDQVLQTHVVAAQRLTRAVLPGMLERQHGSIVFIGSMTSLLGIPLVVAYSAAKSACVGMVRSLAAEVSGRGVRVNAIAPGWIESPMLRKALDGDEERTNKILSRTPMSRFGDPEDIGWAATYLCSPAAKFVTGTLLPVDGGASIGF